MLNIEASKSRPFINLDDDNDTFSPERKYSLKEQFSMACFDFSQALAQYAPADLKGAGIKYLATAEQEMESGEMNEGDMKRAIKVMNNAIDKYKAMSGGQEVNMSGGQKYKKEITPVSSSPERKYSLKEQFSMACFDFSQALAQYAPADLKGAGIKYLATAEQEMESGEMNEGDMKRAIKVMNNAIDKYKAMSGGQEVKQESVPQPLERDNSRKDNVSTIESVAVETENNENLSPQEQFEELSDNYLASINKHFTGSKREELIRVHEAKKNLVRNKKIDKRDIPYMVKAMKNAMKRWESGNNKPLAVPKLEINLND